MDSFYILLAVTILTGAIAGYLAGFVRFVFLFIKAGIALTAVYFLSPFIDDILTDDTATGIQWLMAFVFLTFFVVVFIIAHWLLQPIYKPAAPLHKTRANKIGGLFFCVTCMVISMLLFVQVTGVVEMPALVKEGMEAAGADVLTGATAQTTANQPVKVMGSETKQGTAETGVWLTFKVNNYTLRPELESQLLGLVNEERAKQGLRLLKADPELQVAARKHSVDMFQRGYFSHVTPEGIDPFQRLRSMNISYLRAGENLAMAPSLSKAHEGLMNSPGHRANILNPSYGRAGIAVIDGGTHGLMITQEFRN